MRNINRKHIAFARAAGATVNVAFDPNATRTDEQQTAYLKLLDAVGGDAARAEAIYTEAAKPDTGPTPLDVIERVKRAASGTKRNAKPAEAPKPEAPKAAKPSKPSDADAKRAADYDARVKLVGELRVSVSALYNGPSLAVRSNPKRIAATVYAELLAAPKHRTTLDKISERDESALFLILKRGTKTGGFDPVALNLDSGIFSRLSSVGFVARDGDSFTLTPAALTHARSVAKRHTAKAA